MKFAAEWLAAYLPGEAPSTADLRTRLTGAGFIVEGVEGEGAEAVLDVEITANRPDAMSHRGLAREAAAALSRPFSDPEANRGVPEEAGEEAAALATVRIEEPGLCSRFSARVVRGIEMRPSPAGVQARFARLGLGAISAPVDATNHVLWDIGQPLHAYDLDLIAKGEDGKPLLVVRHARKGETLVTLDGVERKLEPAHLVIADAEKPVGLAGVMGGLATAISATTKNILLEAAHFDAGVVRRTARSLGMHTDASHRFERGADPRATVEGLARAARMIAATCRGRVAAGAIDVLARAFHRKRLSLREEFLHRTLGMKVPFEEAREILKSLGFVCSGSVGVLEVTVPSWRVDVDSEIDLVEEVIRLLGYDTLPETLPQAHVPTRVAESLEREERARDVFSGAGLLEAYGYSFVSASENAPFVGAAPGAPVLVANALGEPFTTMRGACTIGLLRAARHNVRRGFTDLALFEVGRAYGRVEARPVESRRVAVLFHGARRRHWSEPERLADFHDGSGAVAALFSGLGANAPRFVSAEVPFLAPGRAARVVTAEGEDAGWVGVLAPALAAAWDLTDPVVAEVDLLAIRPLPRPASVEAPSRLPGSEVDLTAMHPLGRRWEELSEAVREGAPAELQAVDVKYRYQGAGVPAGFVKTTLNLKFGSSERSLSREEVNGWRDAAARRLVALPDTTVDGVS